MREETIDKLKKTEQEILDEISTICDENDLKYFLVGGGLIGAVRHKGFIPWDDDIDIAMPRDDYNRFSEILRNTVNSNYILCDWSCPDYYLPHAKLQKKGTIFEESFVKHLNKYNGIFVDIFMLDNAKKQKSLLQEIQGRAFKRISAFLRLKIIIKPLKDKTIKQKIGLFLSFPFSSKMISKLMQKIMTLNKDDGSKYYVNLASQYNFRKQTIEKNKYMPCSEVEFEGKYYRAPKDWHYFLTRIYGDYMKLPPEHERVLSHSPVRIEF